MEHARAPSTALVYDPACLAHVTDRWHPDQPERLQVVLRAIRDAFGDVTFLSPIEVRRDTLERVHDPEYLALLEQLCAAGGGLLDLDTPVGPRSYQAALAAVGAACRAVDVVCTGVAPAAFALVRPPGHHALRSRAMGFCLLNNVAVAARHAQQARGIRRVLIVEWDVHHGNGTQDSFFADPDVAYFSVHRWPFYPGTGGLEDVGRGDGHGTSCNVPLPAGAGDADFLSAFREVLAPFARRMTPDLVLVSAGYDTHRADPLGGMAMTEAGYAALGTAVRALADELCAGRLVLVLEGGYDLQALGASVVATLAGLEAAGPVSASPTPQPSVHRVIDTARAIHELS